MKFVSTVLFALALTSGVASADPWGRPGRPGHPGGPGWGNPGWGMCSVTFKKCDFALNGFCVKWNNKGFQVARHEARYACYRAQQEYGQIKDCYVQCN